jgi:hypothetical protein
MGEKTMAARHLLAMLVVLGLASAAADEKPRPGDSSRAVTRERLLRERLVNIQRDPALEWTFTEKRFVLQIDGKATPHKLLEMLMGAKDAVRRVEGGWELDEAKGRLLLTDLTGDGKPGKKAATLEIAPAGLIRINLGEHQYNTFPVKERPR